MKDIPSNDSPSQSPEDSFEFRESFGDFLRRHREASGKSLDQVAKTTRIPKRYLQAFEENEPSKLPEPAFARGFLRSYAGEIGLDVEDTLVRYERFQKSLMPTQVKDVRELKRAKEPVVLASDTEELRQKSQSWLAWVLSGGAIVAAVIAALLWGIHPDSSSEESETNTEEYAEQTPAETTPSPTAPADEKAVELEPAPTTPAPAAKKEAAPSAPVMATPVSPSILSVRALKDAALSVRVDDNALEQLSLKSGETRTLNVYREVEIRSTDKQAFQFQYNGKALEVSGPVIKLFNRHLFTKQK